MQRNQTGPQHNTGNQLHNQINISAATEENPDTPLSCLLAALTRLMTYYAMHPNSENARAVVRILKTLEQHPAVVEQPLLQNTYGRMLPHWQGLAVSQQQWALMATAANGRMH